MLDFGKPGQNRRPVSERVTQLEDRFRLLFTAAAAICVTGIGAGGALFWAFEKVADLRNQLSRVEQQIEGFTDAAKRGIEATARQSSETARMAVEQSHRDLADRINADLNARLREARASLPANATNWVLVTGQRVVGGYNDNDHVPRHLRCSEAGDVLIGGNCRITSGLGLVTESGLDADAGYFLCKAGHHNAQFRYVAEAMCLRPVSAANPTDPSR